MEEHTINAKNEILGRLAVKVANLLRGKGKPEFVPHMDMGDKVTIINTDKIKVTGQKATDKIYYHHTGYPGGIKEMNFEDAIKRDSRKVVRKAVYGMLPKNKLRNQIIKKLDLYRGEQTK